MVLSARCSAVSAAGYLPILTFSVALVVVVELQGRGGKRRLLALYDGPLFACVYAMRSRCSACLFSVSQLAVRLAVLYSCSVATWVPRVVSLAICHRNTKHHKKALSPSPYTLAKK